MAPYGCDMNIKSQDEMVMFEVIAQDLHQKLGRLIASNQCVNMESNDKNRQLLKYLLGVKDKCDLKHTFQARFVSSFFFTMS